MWTACRSIPAEPSGPHRATEAERLVRERDFFTAGGAVVPVLSFEAETDFRFRSALQTPWSENDVVYGRLYRAGSQWQTRPAVVLLHGWNGEDGYRWQFPLLARGLRRAGVNAAMLELPYHGRRKPHGPGAIRNFISHDLVRMAEAVSQSLADARGLMGWLLEQGCPAVGFWGVSLGAWLTGLLAAREPRAAFAVLLTPVIRMDRALVELPFCEPLRRSLQGTPLRLDPFNLVWHPPPPRDRVLIIESEYDLFGPKETVEELWRAWGHPEIWRYRHGHISILFSWPVLSKIVAWIAEHAVSGSAAVPVPR